MRMPDVPFLNITGSGARMRRWDVVCVHTIVGFQNGGNAAHFTTGASGHIVQARDTAYQSAANYLGNYRVIAIENEDHGPAFGPWDTRNGHTVPGFTPEQIESIAKICVWANRAHGIPLTLCPNSRTDSRGIGYHRQGIDGNFGPFDFPGRVSGGELWSTAGGKVCPGDRRIAQLITTIIPRARELAGLTSPEDKMGYADDIMRWMAETRLAKLPDGHRFKGKHLGDMLLDSTGYALDAAVIASRIEARLLAMQTDLAELADDELNIIAAVRAQQAGDPRLVAEFLAPLLLDGGLVAGLSEQDFERLVRGVADEADRRARERANIPVPDPR